jgi:uncharacterized sulfatase
MIGLDADVLVSGHARPIAGKENVRRVLTDYRDAIDFVLHETLAGANRGLTPDELAATVTLPEPLVGKDYLQEFYGVIDWSVRSIYSGYFGWFDGNPTNLFPLTPREEAERMVRLIGSEGKLLNAIRGSIADHDYQWACRLADVLLALEPPVHEARKLKANALRAIAQLQTSSNARHYYLSVAYELEALSE